MKKATMESLVRHLNGEAVENLDEIKAELVAELAKGKAKADANRATYEGYRVPVLAVMKRENRPLSAKDIANETGIALGKVVRGLNHEWADAVKVDNSRKPSEYSLR